MLHCAHAAHTRLSPAAVRPPARLLNRPPPQPPARLPQEIGEEDAERLAALLEQRLGKKFEDIGVEDMTDEVTSEVRAVRSTMCA